MEIKFNNRDPVYVQVVRHFKQQIATNMLEPGQEMPSRREMARELKINPNTVQRAYKEMEEQGLIYTEGNLPSKVTKDEKMLQSVREELILEAVDKFITAIHSIQVPFDEVVSILRSKYNQVTAKEETQ
jgi:GntR family transcriptional regulator